MRWLALVLVLVPAVVAAAEPVRVRSGDHEGFTRLTFSIPPGLVWSVEGHRVGFGADVALETADVFERIGRDRLQAITATPRAAILTLGCECRLSAFLQGETLLVVDIAPAPADDGQTRLQLPRLRPASEPSLTIPVPAAAVPPPAPLADGPPPPSEVPQSLADLSYALNRAAALGLIETETSSPPQADNLTQEFPRASGQMRAHASTDLETVETGGQANATTCPERDRLPALALLDWSEFSDLRATVTLPTGKIDQGAARALVDGYLSLGFGAEAQAMLALVAQPTGSLAAHSALAGWFEGQKDQPFFAPDLLFCAPEVAFWSFVQTPDAPQADSVDLLVLVEAFLDLPPPVQDLARADFALALLDRDRTDLVQIVQRRRGPDAGEDEEGLILQAEAAARQQDWTAADALLAQAMAIDGPMAPRALQRKIRLALDAGQAPASDDILQARALVAELAETPAGRDLSATLREAMVATGDLRGALDSLDPGVSPDQVLAWGLAYLSDADLAWAAAYYGQDSAVTLASTTRQGLADVLNRLGFAAPLAGSGPETVQLAKVAVAPPPWADADPLPVTVPRAEALLQDTATLIPDLATLIRRAEVLP